MNKPNPQQYRSILIKTLEQLEQLLLKLDEESQALTGSNPQALQDSVRQKLAILAEIERNVIARDQLQIAQGLEPGMDGGQAFVDQQAPELASEWQRFKELCNRVSQRNSENGQLVSQCTRQTRQSLSLLTGRQEDTSTYGRKGTGKGRIRGLSLGRV